MLIKGNTHAHSAPLVTPMFDDMSEIAFEQPSFTEMKASKETAKRDTDNITTTRDNSPTSS
jgi:hypothetical protein